jgi:hypothetical protein
MKSQNHKAKPSHPAFELFKQMFDETAKDPGPVLPTYFMTRNLFHKACRDAGIDCPPGFIDAMNWEEKIGLREFVHKLIAKYHKQHGTDFTPSEKVAWRRRKR